MKLNLILNEFEKEKKRMERSFMGGLDRKLLSTFFLLILYQFDFKNQFDYLLSLA